MSNLAHDDRRNFNPHRRDVFARFGHLVDFPLLSWISRARRAGSRSLVLVYFFARGGYNSLSWPFGFVGARALHCRDNLGTRDNVIINQVPCVPHGEGERSATCTEPKDKIEYA